MFTKELLNLLNGIIKNNYKKIETMVDISVNKYEANVIQVALDHLREEHSDVMADAIKYSDKEMEEFSFKIIEAIEKIQIEIKNKLN